MVEITWSRWGPSVFGGLIQKRERQKTISISNWSLTSFNCELMTRICASNASSRWIAWWCVCGLCDLFKGIVCSIQSGKWLKTNTHTRWLTDNLVKKQYIMVTLIEYAINLRECMIITIQGHRFWGQWQNLRSHGWYHWWPNNEVLID